MEQLRSSIGTSEADDAEVAGKEAAAVALARLGADAALVVVYASVRYDLLALLRAVREVTGETPLVGASSSGHFHEGAVTGPGRGVAVLVLTAGPYRFGIGTATGLRADAQDAGRRLARAARAAVGEEAPHAAVVLLSCGITGDQQELLAGIHQVVGVRVPVVGGAASDDRRMRETYVFHDGEVLADAAVALWVASPRPLPVVRGHGWHPVSPPELVTAVEGQVVRQIGARSAREVFEEHLTTAIQDSADLTALEDGGRHASGRVVRLGEVGRCFGLVEPDGRTLLRGVFIDPEGEVRTFAPLPEYSAVQVMSCSQDDLLDVCEPLVSACLARDDGAGADGADVDGAGADGAGSDGAGAGVLLTFGCVARFEMLKDRAGEEAARIQAAAGDVPTFGFYTYGEFARVNSPTGFHNATIAAIAL